MAAPKVLLVVAHPVIASGLETLLQLEGDYEVKRVASVSEAVQQSAWGAQAALIDGTLLAGHGEVRLGVAAFVLSGNERDGRQLSRKLDDGRGWLRKDATGSELASAIASLLHGETQGDGGGLGTVGTVAVVAVCLLALAAVAYLLWLATY